MITRGYGIVQGVAVGSVIQTFDTTPYYWEEPGPWSIVYNPETDLLWIGGAQYSDNSLAEFNRDGTPTGRSWIPPWVAEEGWGISPVYGGHIDSVFVPSTGMIWTGTVTLILGEFPDPGGHWTRLYEWNPVTMHATGRSIRVDMTQWPGGLDMSMRGVAFDSVNELFYLGCSYELIDGGPTGYIALMDFDGKILNTWNSLWRDPCYVYSLAYNPITEKLWVGDSNIDAIESITEADPADDMAVLQQFLTPWPIDYRVLGMDQSCDGHLWATAGRGYSAPWPTDLVYEIESGDPWACAGTGRIVQYPVLVDEIDVDLDPDITAEVDSSDYEVEIDDLGTGAEVDD